MAIETGQITVEACEIKNFFQDPSKVFLLNCKKLIDSFSCDDFKSIFFLMMDFIQLENYISLVSMPTIEMQKQFMCMCVVNKLDNKVLSELLGTMKKYKLMKNFGSCKHNFDRKHYLMGKDSKWKMLYSICEELEDREVELIKKILQKNAVCSAEELFYTLFKSNKTVEEDFSVLITVFHEIKRPDLIEKVTSFSGSHKEIIAYYIRNPTKEIHCGTAIIINQEKFMCVDEMQVLKDRDGSHIDLEKLKYLWNSFGLKTVVHTNLKAHEVINVFQELSQQNHFCHDIFVACVLSHGDKDIVYGTDCKPVHIDNIVNIMAESPTLNGKPKLFFIQACQGNKIQGDQALQYDRRANFLETDSVSERINIPWLCDMYKAVATIPGYVSYRCTSKGSLFINALVENLRSYGCKEDIEYIMKRVKEDIVAQKSSIGGTPKLRQMPIATSTLRCKVIFKQLTEC